MRSEAADFFRGVVAQLDQYPSIRQCAAANDLPEATLRYWINKLNKENEFEAPEALPPEGFDIDDLLEQRRQRFKRKQAHEEAAKLRRIKLKVDGPFGIHHFGDPHVDDDGTDIITLERHIDIIQKTPAMFAGNIGDTTNNWVGRLARLYANQSTTANDAWMIAEWFVKSVPWLYMIAGNHDAWSGSGDPLKWIIGNADSYASSQVRLALVPRSGREININARHDFVGHSQWNPAHGSMKAAQMGLHDHININGHKHASGYGVIKDPLTGIVSHCIQVASYKVYDTYAKERGFRDQHISPCAVTIIDPQARHESEVVHVFWEPEAAADYLKWLRKKQGV
jgi:hypothetical protein